MTTSQLKPIPADEPDFRDYIFEQPFPIDLPAKIDLRKKCSPIEGQGQLGSCTAQALVGLMEFIGLRTGNFKNLSRLFVYYEERVNKGTVKKDSGASLRDGIKALAKIGAPEEKFWPYNVFKFKKKPPAEAYADAATRKIKEYHRIVRFEDVLYNLALGNPVVFGFNCPKSFLTYGQGSVAKHGNMFYPTEGEKFKGGHAVMAVGYDLEKQHLIIRNSWGVFWGQKGYFTMPFEFASDSRLTADFWIINL